MDDGKAIVFLKYFNSGSGFFSNLVFLKKQKVLLHGLKNLSVLHKNYYYLVLTSKGILSSQQCVSKNISGFLIARF
jgi:ribosomal protein S8